jgi:hypothetical protein
VKDLLQMEQILEAMTEAIQGSLQNGVVEALPKKDQCQSAIYSSFEQITPVQIPLTVIVLKDHDNQKREASLTASCNLQNYGGCLFYLLRQLPGVFSRSRGYPLS